jgi:hypothetical protein
MESVLTVADRLYDLSKEKITLRKASELLNLSLEQTERLALILECGELVVVRHSLFAPSFVEARV